MRNLLLISLFLNAFISTTLFAEEKAITPNLSSKEKLESLFGINQKLKPGVSADVPLEFCPDLEKEKPPQEWRTNLSDVQSSLEAIYRFEREEKDERSTLQSFTLSIKFEREAVTIKHSDPKMSADLGGLRVPWPAEQTREIFLEGQGGSTLWILIPRLIRCETQAILVCPRVFVPRSSLAVTSYAPKAAGFSATGKVDGLLALGPKETGIAHAEISVTDNIGTPNTVSKEGTGSSPQVILTYNSKQEDDRLEISKDPENAGKLDATVFSSLKFAKNGGASFTIYDRTDLTQIRTYLTPDKKAVFRLPALNVADGPCYIFSSTSKHGFILGN